MRRIQINIKDYHGILYRTAANAKSYRGLKFKFFSIHGEDITLYHAWESFPSNFGLVKPTLFLRPIRGLGE